MLDDGGYQAHRAMTNEEASDVLLGLPLDIMRRKAVQAICEEINRIDAIDPLFIDLQGGGVWFGFCLNQMSDARALWDSYIDAAREEARYTRRREELAQKGAR